MRATCNTIVREAIQAVQPDAAVERALSGKTFPSGKLVLIAIGKASWTMAAYAERLLGSRVDCGVVITKYGHAQGPIGNLAIYEAGHPVPDQNTFLATEQVLSLTAHLTPDDTVLFLVSGGGSALFESPRIAPDELADITKQILSCGADITEMNTIRKRLSRVKGGRFAQHCAPAKVFTIVLSDIIGDPLDMIASGPAYPDRSTWEDALRISKKYHLRIMKQAEAFLREETPKELDNVETVITGSVRELCTAAAASAETLGYRPIILTDSLCCEAREAGSFLASLARYYQSSEASIALIAGGETVVHLKGSGLGGRNQELALSAAVGIRSCRDTAVLSFGSDGTDGPTDAAGGYVTENTAAALHKKNISIFDVLQNNDAYHALAVCDGLIKTGPTGTNVNDLSIVLIRR